MIFVDTPHALQSEEPAVSVIEGRQLVMEEASKILGSEPDSKI